MWRPCRRRRPQPANAPLVRREAGELRENRAEGRSGLNDGTFRAKRSTGADGERRGQRLENAHAHADLALADQHGLHGFGNAVALQGRLPKVDHDADRSPPMGGIRITHAPRWLMHREGHGERPPAIKEEVGEKVNQFQQALRHQTAHEPYEKRASGGRENARVERLPEFPDPPGSGRW